MYALVDSAEELVRRAKVAVDAADGYLQRDVAELQECLALQDQALEAVAPVLERREEEVRAGVHAAVAALRGDPMSDWTQRHRRWHSAAVKSRLVERLGRHLYERAFPW